VLPAISPGKGKARSPSNPRRKGKAPAINMPTSTTSPKGASTPAADASGGDGGEADADGAHSDAHPSTPPADDEGGEPSPTTTSPPTESPEANDSSSSNAKKGKAAADAKSPVDAAKARRLKMAKAKEARRAKAASPAKGKGKADGGGGRETDQKDDPDGAASEKADDAGVAAADSTEPTSDTTTPPAPAPTEDAADGNATPLDTPASSSKRSIKEKVGVGKKKKASVKAGGAKKKPATGSKVGGKASHKGAAGAVSKVSGKRVGGGGGGSSKGKTAAKVNRNSNDTAPINIMTDADVAAAAAEAGAESSMSASAAAKEPRASESSAAAAAAAAAAGGGGGGVVTAGAEEPPPVSNKIKVKEMMQLSPPQLERITKAFQKFDRDKNGDVNKNAFTAIMEELGQKPEKEEDLDKLWKSKSRYQKQSKRPLHQKDEFLMIDEYIKLMAAMIGVMATPGVLLHVLALDFKTSAQEEARQAKEAAARLATRQEEIDKRQGKKTSMKKGGRATTKKKGASAEDDTEPKQIKKKEAKKTAPQLTLRVAGFMNAKESVKARKTSKQEALRSPNVKNKVVYHTEMFLECPVNCDEMLIIEAVRSRKTVARDGRMTRDIIGCALVDISKLTDGEETLNITLFKPVPIKEPESVQPASVSRRASDMSMGASSSISAGDERGGNVSDGGGAGGPPEKRVSLKVPGGKEASALSSSSSASQGSGSKSPHSTRSSTKSSTSRGSKGSVGKGKANSKELETELLGVTADAGADAGTTGKGDRAQSQLSLLAKDIELTDEPIGTLHLTARRHLFVAKEKGPDAEYDSDGELIDSGRPLSGQDSTSVPYDQVERELKRMLAKTVTDTRTNEQNNPLVEDMWHNIDFQGMGLISLSAMDKFISKKFHVLKNTETLLYAYKLCSNSNRSSNLSSLSADRRSWVTFQDFMKLLCHQFYFKRFWAVYERYLYVGEGGTYVSSPDITIDMKDFSFILKRSGVRLGDHDASTLFEACQIDDSTGKVPLAAACHVTTMRVFFPMSSEAKAASQPNAAAYAATVAAKMKKRNEKDPNKRGPRNQPPPRGARSAAASGGKKGGGARQPPGRGPGARAGGKRAGR